MSNRYEQRGREIGALVDRKNRAYGSSFAKSGEFLRLLYPHGMRPEQYADALLLARIFDKQMRVATDADAFGESPFADIAGYGLLGAEQHRERVSKECGSAKGDVGARSRETPSDSAEHGASGSTMPNANGRSDGSSTMPSNSPSEPTSASTAAPAPTAMASAFQSVVARGKEANDRTYCGNYPLCERRLGPGAWRTVVRGLPTPASLIFCGFDCANIFFQVNL